jgi:hypothetical protein
MAFRSRSCMFGVAMTLSIVLMFHPCWLSITRRHQKPVDRILPSYVSVQLISLSYDDGGRGLPVYRERNRGGGCRMTLRYDPFHAYVVDPGGTCLNGHPLVSAENGGRF